MKTREENTEIWKKLRQYIVPYKRKLIIIMICMLFISSMTFLQPMLIREITDSGIMHNNMNIVVKYIILFLISAVFLELVKNIQNKKLIEIRGCVYDKLNGDAFNKIYLLPLKYYKDKNPTEVINMVLTDIQTIVAITERTTAFSILAFLQILVGIVGIFLIDYRIAISIIVLIPIKFIIVQFFSLKKSSINKMYLESNRKYHAWLGDQIAGIREGKMWDLYLVRLDELRERLNEINNIYKNSLNCDQYRESLDTLVNQVMNCVVYFLGGILAIKGKMSVGNILALITYCAYVIGPLSLLINAKYIFAGIRPSLERLFDFLALEEEKNTLFLREQTDEFLEDEVPVIEFCNVSFEYKKDKKILQSASIKIYKGEHIGIVGDNGVGKSTVFDLILGFAIPQEGSIKICGKPIEELGVRNVREKIACVSQSPYIFHASVRGNVDLKGNITDEEVEMVCRQSGAYDFIEKFKLRYSEKIGGQGEKISCGEKQKIAMARELLKKTDILLLDEACNGYDEKSGEKYLETLYTVYREKTIIMITHHKKELEYFDMVYELKEGKFLKNEKRL